MSNQQRSQVTSLQREQITAAMLRVFAPDRHLITPEEFRLVDELTDAVMQVRDRDMQVLADEITRLSAVTGQLRALANRWQTTVRPSESHPAAAAILGIIDDNGPTVRECAEADRRWPLEKEGE